LSYVSDLQIEFEEDHHDLHVVKKHAKECARRKQENADRKSKEFRGYRGRKNRVQNDDAKHIAASRRTRFGMQGVKSSLSTAMAAFNTYVRIGKLPTGPVDPFRRLKGVDKRALAEMIAKMLERGGVELNPGPRDICDNCGGKGHKKSECPSQKNAKRIAKNHGPRDKSAWVKKGVRNDDDRAAGDRIAAQEKRDEEREKQPPPLLEVGREVTACATRYGDFRREVKNVITTFDLVIFVTAVLVAALFFVGTIYLSQYGLSVVFVRLGLFIVMQARLFLRERANFFDRLKFVVSLVQAPFLLVQFVGRLFSDSIFLVIMDELGVFVQLVSFVSIFFPSKWSTDWRVRGQDLFVGKGTDDDYAVEHGLVKEGMVVEYAPVRDVQEIGGLLPTQQRLEHATAAGLVSMNYIRHDIGPNGKIRRTSNAIVISSALHKLLRLRITNMLGMEREKAIVELMRYAENQNSIRLPPDNDVGLYPITLNTVHYAVDRMFAVPSCPNAGTACFY